MHFDEKCAYKWEYFNGKYFSYSRSEPNIFRKTYVCFRCKVEKIRKKVLHRLHNSFVHNTEINRAVAEVKTQIGDKQKIKEDETNYVNSLKMLVEENIVL